MLSFVTTTVLLALTGGSLALPTGNGAVARRGEGFFFPLWIPPAPAPAANGAITATGANGGYNYGGSGANGGTISISRREEDSEGFFFPLFFNPPAPAANGPITANGANGGTNYYGNGANGGAISISKRDEDFFFPLWIPPAPPAANGPITASGANGGTNIYGNGANGGKISISAREEASEDAEDFFFPLWIPPAPPAANGAITASGANGGYNYGGSGANGGTISIST